MRTRTTITARTVSLPNDVVIGETSGRCSTRSATASGRTGGGGAGDRHALRLRRAPAGHGQRTLAGSSAMAAQQQEARGDVRAAPRRSRQQGFGDGGDESAHGIRPFEVFTREMADAVRYDASSRNQSSTTVTLTSMLPRVAFEYGHTW